MLSESIRGRRAGGCSWSTTSSRRERRSTRRPVRSGAEAPPPSCWRRSRQPPTACCRRAGSPSIAAVASWGGHDRPRGIPGPHRADNEQPVRDARFARDFSQVVASSQDARRRCRRSCRSSCAERSPRHPTSLALDTALVPKAEAAKPSIPRSMVERSSLLTTSAPTPIWTRWPNRASTVTSSPATACSCETPVDSDYENYGDTCAGRQAAGTDLFCGLERSAIYFNRLVAIRCPRRDLATTRSSKLWRSPATPATWRRATGSTASPTRTAQYRVYGDTCAGRQPENTGSYCTALTDPVPGTGSAPDSPGIVPTTVADRADHRHRFDEPANRPDVARPPSRPPRVPTATNGAVPRSSPPTTLPTPSSEVPAPTLEPTGLGDDPTLDALAQSCYDGDLAACDTLYQEYRDRYAVPELRRHVRRSSGGDKLRNVVRRRLGCRNRLSPTGISRVPSTRPTTDDRHPDRAACRRRQEHDIPHRPDDRVDRCPHDDPALGRDPGVKSPRRRSSRPASAPIRPSMRSPSPVTTGRWRLATSCGEAWRPAACTATSPTPAPAGRRRTAGSGAPMRSRAAGRRRRRTAFPDRRRTDNDAGRQRRRADNSAGADNDARADSSAGDPRRHPAAHRPRRRPGVRSPRSFVLRRRHAGVRRPVRSGSDRIGLPGVR